MNIEIQHELVTLFSTTFLRKLAKQISEANIAEKDMLDIAKLIRKRYKSLRKKENDSYRKKLTETESKLQKKH